MGGQYITITLVLGDVWSIMIYWVTLINHVSVKGNDNIYQALSLFYKISINSCYYYDIEYPSDEYIFCPCCVGSPVAVASIKYKSFISFDDIVSVSPIPSACSVHSSREMVICYSIACLIIFRVTYWNTTSDSWLLVLTQILMSDIMISYEFLSGCIHWDERYYVKFSLTFVLSSVILNSVYVLFTLVR